MPSRLVCSVLRTHGCKAFPWFHSTGMVCANYFCIPARRPRGRRASAAEEKLQRQTSPRGRVRSGLRMREREGMQRETDGKRKFPGIGTRTLLSKCYITSAVDMQTSPLWSNTGKRFRGENTQESEKSESWKRLDLYCHCLETPPSIVLNCGGVG